MQLFSLDVGSYVCVVMAESRGQAINKLLPALLEHHHANTAPEAVEWLKEISAMKIRRHGAILKLWADQSPSWGCNDYRFEDVDEVKGESKPQASGIRILDL